MTEIQTIEAKERQHVSLTRLKEKKKELIQLYKSTTDSSFGRNVYHIDNYGGHEGTRVRGLVNCGPTKDLLDWEIRYEAYSFGKFYVEKMKLMTAVHKYNDGGWPDGFVDLFKEVEQLQMEYDKLLLLSKRAQDGSGMVDLPKWFMYDEDERKLTSEDWIKSLKVVAESGDNRENHESRPVVRNNGTMYINASTGIASTEDFKARQNQDRRDIRKDGDKLYDLCERGGGFMFDYHWRFATITEIENAITNLRRDEGLA